MEDQQIAIHTLVNQGYISGYILPFIKNNPESKIITKKGTPTNDLLMYIIEKAQKREHLEKIDPTKLSAKQHEKLYDRIKEFKNIEAVYQEEINLDEVEIDLEPKPMEEAFEDIFEEEEEEDLEVKNQEDLIKLYIDELAKVRSINAQLREKNSQLREKNQEQEIFIQGFKKENRGLIELCREISLLLGKHGINEPLSDESEQLWEALFGGVDK